MLYDGMSFPNVILCCIESNFIYTKYLYMYMYQQQISVINNMLSNRLTCILNSTLHFSTLSTLVEAKLLEMGFPVKGWSVRQGSVVLRTSTV